MGEWAENDPIVALLTPVLILAVPLFDIAFVGVVRVVTGKVHSGAGVAGLRRQGSHPPSLRGGGLSKTQSVFLIYFIAATLGLSAILLKEATPREAALVLLQVACVLAIIAVLEGSAVDVPGHDLAAADVLAAAVAAVAGDARLDGRIPAADGAGARRGCLPQLHSVLGLPDAAGRRRGHRGSPESGPDDRGDVAQPAVVRAVSCTPAP